MLKKITLAALATVSMSAFAGPNHQYQSSSNGWHNSQDIDAVDKPLYDQRKAVEWRADQCLSGSDRFDLTNLLNRAPMSVEQALVTGLCKEHRQAVMINDQMLAYRFPSETTVATTTSTDGTSTTTVTTYDTTPKDWTAMDWSGQDASFRPMRLIMTKSDKPKEISYTQALGILTANLGDTSTAVLTSWWNEKATEQEKDVIVRLLEDDASMADQIYYPSVYMHRSYDWTK